ncbi:MAG TPA: FtsX-like permease family protein, partial [Anaerolineae bacterium]|nr:FtsX-like permease family protein [Anaerolineae bacterium]
GAPRPAVLQSLLLEAVLVALAGGLAGIAVAGLAIHLFRSLIIGLLGTPFLFPGLPGLVMLGLGALALALVGVVLAALVPALRISLQDPAISMRE